MSALDLLAMLNAPLPGNGAGASASGQSDGEADGAFAGLLAMIAPKGDGKGEAVAAATTASVGMSLAPFRFNGSAPLAASDEPSPDRDTAADADDLRLDETAVPQAGLLALTPPPAPSSPPPSPAIPGPAQAGIAAPPPSASPAPSLPINPAVAAAKPAAPPIDPSPEADPSTLAPESDPERATAPTSEGERLVTNGQPAAAAQARPETNAGLNSAAPQGARIAWTGQAPQVTPAPQPGAAPLPATTEATPQVQADTPQAPAAAPSDAAADVRIGTEAGRTAGQQAATTALSPEAARLAQPLRPDSGQTDRRGERRDGESRSFLSIVAEAGESPRPSVAAPAQASTAVAPTPAPAPGTGAAEARTEPVAVTVDAAAPDGEAAPEPVRTTESQSAGALREHLPSTLSRASVETTAMLSAQIVRRLEARSTRFDMVLTPEDLGRVDVRMEVDADGQLTARLAFDNPAAAAELRGRADELRRQLEAAGFQMSDSSLEFAERDGGRRDQPFDRRGRAFAGAGRLADTADAISTPPRWTALSLTPEGVDVKV